MTNVTQSTILVVDDDKDARELLQITLEDDGLRVITAKDGEAGLAAYRLHRPDLLILDVEMPGMSGIELCRSVRQLSEVPILFLSGRGEETDRLVGLETGADDYLTKPVSARELIIKCRRILKRSAPSETLTSSAFEHFCTVCTNCVTTPHQTCEECGAEPPVNGWSLIDESRYEYLGKKVEGRYVLDQFVGAGSVGQVYRAWNQSIQRHLACKIVDAAADADEESSRAILEGFHHEADVMSRLRNPHVVAIHDSIQLRPGVFALFMDFVHGKTLHELLHVIGRMNPRAALELTRQVANGLYEAHGAGLVHRDLKPANIMLERLPAAGFFVRILDFGIAHIVGDETSGFHGTPLYASPEQCRSEPIDERSDIYSLGAVLFRTLTGRPPFEGDGHLEVMQSQIHDPPPQLQDLLHEKVPDALEELIASLLAKDPARRPSDLQIVIRKIDDILLTTGLAHGDPADLELPIDENFTSLIESSVTEVPAQQPSDSELP